MPGGQRQKGSPTTPPTCVQRPVHLACVARSLQSSGGTILGIVSPSRSPVARNPAPLICGLHTIRLTSSIPCGRGCRSGIVWSLILPSAPVVPNGAMESINVPVQTCASTRLGDGRGVSRIINVDWSFLLYRQTTAPSRGHACLGDHSFSPGVPVNEGSPLSTRDASPSDNFTANTRCVMMTRRDERMTNRIPGGVQLPTLQPPDSRAHDAICFISGVHSHRCFGRHILITFAIWW
jgi:hypothetical protein